MTYSFEEGLITSIMSTSTSTSTLLTYLLVGLEEPVSGKIENTYMQNEIGYVFKYPNQQFFNMSVHDEIAFGLKKYNRKIDNLEEHIKQALRLVNLPVDYLYKNPFDLSSGEQEKVALATILALNPKVIILDEPTIYLDASSVNKLKKLLLKLKNEYHKTIIIASNDVNLVYEISDNILFLKNGKISYKMQPKINMENIDKLLKDGFSVPKILEFINLAVQKKKIKLKYTIDIEQLVKRLQKYVK